MKKVFSFLGAVLPHAVLILSLALLTFFIINLINESMAFLENVITKWIVGVDAFLASILAILAILRSENKK